METQSDNSNNPKFSNFLLNNFRFTLLIIAFFDGYYIFANFAGFQNEFLGLINTIFNLYLCILIIQMVKIRPGVHLGKKIISVVVLNFTFLVLVSFASYLIPISPLDPQLTTQSIETLKSFHDSFFFSFFSGIFGAILYVAFCYYLTIWFNSIFSSKFDHIRLLFFASIISFIAVLIQETAYYQIFLISNDVITSGTVTSQNTTSYDNAISLLAFSFLILLIYLTIELFALFKLYSRVTVVQNGTYSDKFNLFNKLEANGHIDYSNVANYVSETKNTDRFCTKCGKKFETNFDICDYCGTKSFNEFE